MRRIKSSNFLSMLGFSPVEKEIYLTLLEHGPLSVLEISRVTNLKRTTVHLNSENLIKKGLVSQTVEGLKRKLVAEKTEALNVLVEKKEQDLELLKAGLPEFVQEINEISIGKNNNESEFKYFEGKDGVRIIYRDVVKAFELRSYVNIRKIYEVFPENPVLFPKAANLGKLRVWKEIIDPSRITKSYARKIEKSNYQYKFFPKDWEMESFFDFMIYDGSVAMITFSGGVLKGTVITNYQIYMHNLKIFELVWSILK